MRSKYFIMVAIYTLSSTYINAQNYYPLAIGNKWEFVIVDWDPVSTHSSKDTTVIKVIGDTLMPNNINYYILTSYFPLGGILRSDSLGIYYYDDWDSTDCLVYKYDTQPSEPYEAYYRTGGGSAIVNLYYADTAEVLYEKVMTLSFDYNWMVGHSITFGNGIGPISFQTSGDGTTSYTNYTLIGYKINGEEHGIINEVTKNIEVIQDYKLYQNYPNPFNPSTIISFSVPEGQNIELNIYDTLGRKLFTLLKKYVQAGENKIEFNGFGLTSGIYYYQLRTEKYIKTKKLVLLK